MSKDLIVFDPSAISPMPPIEALLQSIHDFVGEGKPSSQHNATEKINKIVQWASQKYGSTVSSDSQWAAWPPDILANGHHCTFNLSVTADYITFMMLLSDQCKRLGLILIATAGKNPFVTVPNGGGILD